MITVPCTPDEHRLIVGGATQLVVPGDPEWKSPDDPYALEPDKIVAWHAPQRWVNATGPCPTCADSRYGVGRVFNPQRDRASRSDHFAKDCPDCIDGRKRVALAVTCPTCDGDGVYFDDEGWQIRCATCDRAGSVVFAHATVEAVLPVLRRVAIPRGSGHRHAGHPTLCVGWDSYDILRLWRFAPLDGQPFGVWCSTVLEVDPLPVPGRDFVVLLDGLELT